MPDVMMKKCPQCGQRTTDMQLAQCPYCRVALVSEAMSLNPGVTQDQVRAVAQHILGSWKFWVVLILLVGGAAWGVVQVAQRIIDSRSKDYLSTLEEKTTNRIAVASAQISRQVSNQISTEFKQPRIQSAIERAAQDTVADALTNSLWPSIDAFQHAMARANSQLVRSSNDLAKLDKDIKSAQRKLAQMPTPTPPPVVVQQPAATPPAAAAVPPKSTPLPAATSAAKLVYSSQTLTANGANYVLTIFFKATSATDPVGQVTLIAGTYRQTARVANFVLVTPGQAQPMVLNDTADAAQLKFTIAPGDAPAVALEVTGPTIVRVTSDSLSEDLTLPVAAEKMVLAK